MKRLHARPAGRRPWLLAALLTVAGAQSAAAGQTSDEPRRLEAAARQGAQALQAALAEARQRRLPLVSQERATVVYQGGPEVQEVRFASELSGWDPAASPLLARVADSLLWTLSVELAADARLEYKLIVDGEWITDPLNPRVIDNGLGGLNSVLLMPGYQPPPEVEGEGWRGIVETREIDSRWLPGSRRVRVYLPPGVRRDGDYPVLWVLDGSDYLERARLPLIVENLVARGDLRPCLIVFSDPAERGREYTLNPLTGRFFAEELVPWLHARYPASLRREEHAILGASLGGLTAADLAWRHWDLLGAVLVQSGAFQWGNARFVEWVRPRPAPLIQMRLSVGDWEGTLLQANQRLAEILGSKALAFSCQSHTAGHNWTAWRDALPDLLRGLWPAGEDAPLLGPPAPVRREPAP